MQAFVKIVDVGSFTRAASILHIAQPALSQQVASLEAHFRRRLLVRSRTGVVPTDAGLMLYRHAQALLRQLEQAETDIRMDGTAISGQVSVGLAPLSAAASLALPLLGAVRDRYPNIVLQLHENVGGIISEMVMTGRWDLALTYEAGEVAGVNFKPVLSEDMHLVCLPSKLPSTGEREVSCGHVATLDLLMPRQVHVVRQLVDLAFRRIGAATKVVAEIESVPTLGMAIQSGIGSAIVPWSAASAILEANPGLVAKRISAPAIPVKISLCTSQQFSLTEPAKVVSGILSELAFHYASERHKSADRSAGQPKVAGDMVTMTRRPVPSIGVHVPA